MQALPHYSITPLETLRLFGVFKTLQLVVLKLLRIRPVVLIVRDTEVAGWSPNDDYPIRRATAEDSELFDAAGFKGMLQKKLNEGPGWICVRDGRLVAWNFLGLHRSAIADWLILTTSSAAIWGTGTWVSHDLRGHGLARQIRGYASAWCRERGYRELLVWINLTNYSSLRVSEKLGGKVIGRVTILRLFGTILVHDGRRWHRGHWTASQPLTLSLEAISGIDELRAATAAR